MLLSDFFKLEKSIGIKRFVLINFLSILKFLLKKTFKLFDKQSKTKKLNKFSKLPKEYFEYYKILLLINLKILIKNSHQNFLKKIYFLN